MEESETRRGDGGDEATNTVYAICFNKERNKQHKTGLFILNSQTYAQRVPPRTMRRNLNARVPRAQGAFVRDGPQWEC